MDTQRQQPGETKSKSSQNNGVLSDTSHNGVHQESRHQFVHRDAAIAATKHITQDACLIIIPKTGTSKNIKQHAIGCVCIHTVMNSHQGTV